MFNQMLAQTLSQVVQSLGPMKDEHAEMVKKILALQNEFHPAKIALGCYLEDCLKSKNYIHLDQAAKDMADVSKLE